MFVILNFGHCDLFVIWDLKCGIFYLQFEILQKAI
jgi:hypothetical protein